jgi:hypothetical protein
MRNNQ